MNDLIDRKQLKDALIDNISLNDSVLSLTEKIFGFIKNAPTIDAAPIRHGEWVFGVTMNHEWMKCSECLISQIPNGCFTYCPNCGAKMDGKRKT